jgi:hypothetical protein
MAGDADEPAQTLVAGVGECFDRAFRRKRDRRAPGPVRSPVLVARNTLSRLVANHGASRSSESP